MPQQRAIAHVLGTLDDKIELNRRMNETLEEMARALFKSWFVDFEPVRAKMDGRWRRASPSPASPPSATTCSLAGWWTQSLGRSRRGGGLESWDDVIELLSGGTPKTSESGIGVERYLGTLRRMLLAEATCLPWTQRGQLLS